MPSPDTALSVLRPDLSGAFEEFDLMMDRQGFIAQKVLPTIDVGLQASTFGKIPIEQLLKNRDTKRAPGSGYARSKFTFTTASYACEEHGAEEPVDDRERQMYRHLLDAELIAAQRAIHDVMINAEKRVSAAVFNATTWTNNTTGITHEWDDHANAVPVDDVEAACLAVWAASGMWPNSLIINRKVFRNLRQCAQIRARISSSGAGDSEVASGITANALAQVFDLEQVIVGGGAKNTADEGLTASISPIWSDEYAMVAKIPNSSDFREPGVGRTFHYTDDGSDIDGRLESYRDETVRSDIIRVRHDVDEVVLYVEAGHLLSNVTT